MEEKKPCKCHETVVPVEEESYPIYVQSSNPTKELLEWVEKMAEDHIIYFQSGHPAGPPCGGPGRPPC